ncbi:MAG: hypothetical protein ACTHMY_15315, partial [Solirubrobacteraceae bacterium]
MRFSSLVRRRPSASLIVSFVALFVALGGVGYAATQLPRNSVGSAQLKNGSVGNWKLKFNAVGGRKIINGAVGAKQVNSTQVQLRVGTPCSTGAVKAIGLSGTVTCTPTLPNEVGTSASAVTLGASSTQVATESLPAGSSYLVLAYPHAVISGAASQRVEVACTLSVPPGTGTSTTTKSLAVELGSSSNSQAGTIPLVLPVASSTSAQTATVSCTDSASPGTPAPTVAVDSTLNA